MAGRIEKFYFINIIDELSYIAYPKLVHKGFSCITENEQKITKRFHRNSLLRSFCDPATLQGGCDDRHQKQCVQVLEKFPGNNG
jgi:hypothetical protein